MLGQRFSLRRKQRLIAIGFVVVPLIVALVVLLALKPVTSHAANAGDLANGSSGSGCFTTSAPVCTFTQRDASADFSSLDGCVATDAFVSVFENLTRPGNSSSQFVQVGISKYDVCNQVQLLAAFNIDFTGTIQFGAGLSSVTVAGTATMFDKLSSATFTATLNLTWQGIGPTTRTVESFHSHGAGVIVNARFNGTSRAADAAGTLSDGTTNFAATPTLIAELDSANSGTVSISTP